MKPDRLASSLEAAIPHYDAIELRHRLDRLSAERALLVASGVPSQYDDAVREALTAALFAELHLEDKPRETEINVLDDIAHALTHAMDLLRFPLSEELENAELAATLFSAAEQTPKGVAVMRGYMSIIRTIERAASQAAEPRSLHPFLTALVAAFVLRDMKATSRVAGLLESAARAEQLVRDDSRLALTLAAICGHLDRMAREEVRPDDLTTLTARIRLARRICIEIGDERYMSSVERLIASVRTFVRNATRLVAARSNIQLAPEYWNELVGTGARHPILELWPPQRDALPRLMTEPSIVVSMPTSAGKTLLAEFRIADVLAGDPNSLVVYVAPYTSLAQQVRDKLSERLPSANLGEPRVWTGSYEIDSSLDTLGRILVMTPEKLDYVLRARLEDDPRTEDLESRLRLVVLDECHLIGTEGRGLTYELLVSRLRERLPRVQVCAMSAVLGNPEPLAAWVAGSEDRIVRSAWKPGRARVIVYDRDGRIVDSSGHPIAELARWSVAKKAAAGITAALVEAGEWPVLVMESQRGYAEDAATQLLDLGLYWDDGDEADDRRSRAATIAQDMLGGASSLPAMLRSGIAFHHAGLPPVLRNEIEALTRSRYLRVVASTTTLAEGIDLPFRVVVCPHINYESGYMSRQLFQNIAGRAGRAFSGVEGWIVFLEPGSAKLSKHLWEVLLGEGETPLQLRSYVSQLGRVLVRPDDWHNDWRYQSQLLGLLGDGHETDDQVSSFLSRTFAAATGGGNATFTARRRGRQIFEALAEEPALALAASPYRLTAFGKAGCLTGLSADSVRVLPREIEHATAEDDWAVTGNWMHGAELPLLEDIIGLAFSPLEALSRAIRMPERYSEFGKTIRYWRDDDSHDIFDAVVAADVPILLHWLSGADVRQLAEDPPNPLPGVGPLRKETSLERLMDLNNYCSRVPSLLAWMYSGAVRVAEYLTETEDFSISEEVRLGVDYLRFGVSSPAARFLADSAAIPRTAATVLAASLSFDPVELETTLLQSLLEHGIEALQSSSLDDWTIREAARAIRDLQPG